MNIRGFRTSLPTFRATSSASHAILSTKGYTPDPDSPFKYENVKVISAEERKSYSAKLETRIINNLSEFPMPDLYVQDAQIKGENLEFTFSHSSVEDPEVSAFYVMDRSSKFNPHSDELSIYLIGGKTDKPSLTVTGNLVCYDFPDRINGIFQLKIEQLVKAIRKHEEQEVKLNKITFYQASPPTKVYAIKWRGCRGTSYETGEEEPGRINALRRISVKDLMKAATHTLQIKTEM